MAGEVEYGARSAAEVGADKSEFEKRHKGETPLSAKGVRLDFDSDGASKPSTKKWSNYTKAAIAAEIENEMSPSNGSDSEDEESDDDACDDDQPDSEEEALLAQLLKVNLMVEVFEEASQS